MKKIYTIGYEGASIQSLVRTLEILGVEALADVRELPLSRKKGFSKNGLSHLLEQHSISYFHFRNLGDPKPGRVAAREKNYELFEKIYLDHLATPPAQQALEDLLRVADSKITCMLCFERCASVCHRSYIADQIANYGFTVFNIVADRPTAYETNEIEIPSYRPRKSVTAA